MAVVKLFELRVTNYVPPPRNSQQHEIPSGWSVRSALLRAESASHPVHAQAVSVTEMVPLVSSSFLGPSKEDTIDQTVALSWFEKPHNRCLLLSCLSMNSAVGRLTLRRLPSLLRTEVDDEPQIIQSSVPVAFALVTWLVRGDALQEIPLISHLCHCTPRTAPNGSSRSRKASSGSPS